MLDHKEWLRINDIVVLINSTKEREKLCKYFLEAIYLLIPYEKAMFYFVKEDEQGLHLIKPCFINVDNQFAKAYEKSFLNSPSGRVAISARKSFVYRDTDLMTDDVRMNSEAYKSFLSPYNVPYGGGIILAKEAKPVAEITFFRTLQQGDFSNKELFILDILKDHLTIRFSNINKSETMAYHHVDQLHTFLLNAGLTIREIDVTKLALEGLTNYQISEKLHISENTTKKHFTQIYTKLKVKNRSQLSKTVVRI